MKYEMRFCPFCTDVHEAQTGVYKKIFRMHCGENYPNHCMQCDPLPEEVLKKITDTMLAKYERKTA